MSSSVVTLDRSGPRLTITLNRPARHNSLVPDLLRALVDALRAAAQTDARVAVITGAGRSFSTGGDLLGFWKNRERIADYAAGLVGLLNEAILALDALPMPTIARVNGPVTGGSVGLMLACDLPVMAPGAFVQPYYAKVGFAPDGGWTFFVPECIGRARTARWLLLDERLDAPQATEIGLADTVPAVGDLDDAISGWVTRLANGYATAHASTLTRLRGAERRRHLANALDAEQTAFIDTVVSPEVLKGIARFLGASLDAD